ncbi:MAG: hypothetical protein OXC84_03190 [Gammaproteobacteria bacterium]|nr:hypothetical protein [Gammaproteobacteria bacterium]
MYTNTTENGDGDIITESGNGHREIPILALPHMTTDRGQTKRGHFNFGLTNLILDYPRDVLSFFASPVALSRRDDKRSGPWRQCNSTYPVPCSETQHA